MKYFVKILSLSPIIFIISLFLTIPALALPPFPSSFYGTVKINGANVPDGTVIEALIDGQLYAEGFTETYQGASFVALNVPGDDTSTATLDGGREGDAIQFKIAGVLADQTAVWHVGTNARLDLTAVSTQPISQPHKTPRPVPTQTAMVMQVVSPLPDLVQASPAPTLRAQPSPISTISSKSLQAPAADGQPTPKDAPLQGPLQSDEENGSGSTSVIAIVVIALPIMSVGGYVFMAYRRRKM